jgi:hypothetical protein
MCFVIALVSLLRVSPDRGARTHTFGVDTLKEDSALERFRRKARSDYAALGLPADIQEAAATFSATS